MEGTLGRCQIGESVHSYKVLENAGSVEEIEDDVVMAEHDSDEELPAEELAEAEPEMEEGGEPSSIDPLVVKGIKWTIVNNLVDTHYIPKQRAHILWNRTQQLDSENSRRELDYFLWSFPDKAVAEILDCTSSSILKSTPSAILVSKGELFKLLGFLLSLTRTHSKRFLFVMVSFQHQSLENGMICISTEWTSCCSTSHSEDGDPAHGILRTTSISVGKKVTIHHGPFVCMSPCRHGMKKMDIFVTMACHMLQR